MTQTGNASIMLDQSQKHHRYISY